MKTWPVHKCSSSFGWRHVASVPAALSSELQSRPATNGTDGVDYGLGNIQPQVYLSPAHPGKFIWGAGGEAYRISTEVLMAKTKPTMLVLTS